MIARLAFVPVLVLVAMTLTLRPGRTAATGIEAISAGGSHSCALTGDGAIRCWGDNTYGQLGDDSVVDSARPVTVCEPGLPPRGPGEETSTAGGEADCTPIHSFSSLSAGAAHTCAVTFEQTVHCWGLNFLGQLGDGTTADSDTPRLVCSEDCGKGGKGRPLSGITAVSAGLYHTCALKTTGQIVCWGADDAGQLGNGTAGSSNIPDEVCSVPTKILVCTTLSGFVTVAASEFHTCGVTSDGNVLCWGSNNQGQLGDGTRNDRQSPVPVCADAGCTSPLGSVTANDAGDGHSCALVAGGAMRCWGDNSSGQLGNNTSEDSLTPVSPCRTADHAPSAQYAGVVELCAPVDNIASTSLGFGVTCITNSSAGVECWGVNIAGQVGDGTNTDRDTPSPVCLDEVCSSSLGGAEAVSAGAGQTCALVQDGVLRCWGANDSGELGDGTNINRNVPVIVIDVKPTPAQTATVTTTPPAGASATPTRTSTPTPIPAFVGDVNCDGDISAIDAALVLQYGAGLLQSLLCQSAANVNGDSSVNAIDSALILQYVAGLIDTLPPG